MKYFRHLQEAGDFQTINSLSVRVHYWLAELKGERRQGRHARVILIFEGAICLPWNHPFYCLFCRADFKTVFVFKIEPILVVHVKI